MSFEPATSRTASRRMSTGATNNEQVLLDYSGIFCLLVCRAIINYEEIYMGIVDLSGHST